MNSIRVSRLRLLFTSGLLLSLLLAAAGLASAQSTNFHLESLGGNGVLAWTNFPGAVSYKVQWAPTVSGPWNDSWDSLARIPATGAVYQVAVPMYYRLAAVTVTNTLLIHGDGPDGSTTIRDESGHALLAHGGVQISTARSVFGGASLHFDGQSGYLISPMSEDWSFGTGDFTVDLWVNFTELPTITHLVGPHTSGLFTDWAILYQSGAIHFFINGAPAMSSAWVPALGTWYHLAATRAAGTLSLFLDGQLRASGSNLTRIDNTRALSIGASENPSLFLSGYLDEIRVRKGTAAWTNNFTPPTSPYDR